MKLSADRAIDFATRSLERQGVPSADARAVALCLVQADLEGQTSHGLIRLPFLLRRLATGLINPVPELRLLQDRPSASLLDGDNALGPVVGLRATAIATEKARATGCGVVAVRRSNHLGALGFYVDLAAKGGVIALAFSNTPPAMTPPGGRLPLLGTNPIAAAFPTSGQPVVVDMATTLVARGRILQAAQAGELIPEGWAIDALGRPTTDPTAALQGALSPLGGAKGFGLALLVEVLSAVLSGSAVGPDVGGTFAATDSPSDVGHCFICIDPTAFGETFVARLDGLVAAIRAVPPVNPSEPVRVPGQRRQAERADRLREGINLPDELVTQLADAAGEMR